MNTFDFIHKEIVGVASNQKDKTILEYGCGKGGLIKQIPRGYSKILAVDVNDYALSHIDYTHRFQLALLQHYNLSFRNSYVLSQYIPDSCLNNFWDGKLSEFMMQQSHSGSAIALLL